MTYPLDNFGCEFYLGNAQVIGQACNQGKWKELHSGQFATIFVGFPQCVQSLDVLLLLSKAISEVTQQPEIVIDQLLKSVAGDEGTWGAEILPLNWIRSVADIPIEIVIPVWQCWKTLREQEYGFDEDWDSSNIVKSLFDLQLLCQLAISKNEDVVEVWNL